MLALGVLAAALAGCLAASPPPSSPGPAGIAQTPSLAARDASTGEDLPLLQGAHSAKVSAGSEPSVLADRNGKYVWIGDSSGGHYSTDNGTSWAAMPDFKLPGAFVDGWALAQDGSGKLYAAALQGSVLDVARSGDGGRSWEQVTHAAGVSGSADRPWLASRGNGEVVLFYFDAPAVGFGFYEYCTRSTDGGASWLDRNPVAGTPSAGKAFFDADGHFYYSQTDGTLFQFTGACLSTPKQIPMLAGPAVNNFIQGDAWGNDLYMAAAMDGSSRIVLAGSHGGGAPKTLTVSPPSLKTNTYATLSAWGDQVAVAWYGSETPGDFSANGFAGDFNVYLAIVTDFWGNATVTQSRLTGAPMHHGTICTTGLTCTGNRGLLDYFMVDHDIWGGLHVAYVDDTTDAGVRYLHIPPGATAAPTGGPSARFTFTVEGNRVRADASRASGMIGGPLTYGWDWGDGSPRDTGIRASHTYKELGAYTITLTVTDGAGRTATQSQNIVVGSATQTGTGEPTNPPAGTSTHTGPGGSGPSSPTGKAKRAPGLGTALLVAGLAAFALRRR
jgi:hypothetical protein